MNNLSASSSTVISNQIGALEVGDYLESYDDGVLEVAGKSVAGPTRGYTCRVCRDIGDEVLEAAGANMALAPFPRLILVTRRQR